MKPVLQLALAGWLSGSMIALGELTSRDLSPRSKTAHPTLFEKVDPKAAGFDLSPFPLSEDLKTRIKKSPLSSLEDSYQGVCIGDVDGDDRPDIFLAHPYGGQKLYRNLGDFTFQDVTKKAGLHNPDHWGKGACFVDIDNDEDLDLFVCGHTNPNLLYINQGDGTFKEAGRAFGLAFDGYSVMMNFADIDLDGDLDAFLVTGGSQATPPEQKLEMKIKMRYKRAILPEEYVEKVDVLMHPEDGPIYVTAGQRDHLYRNNGNGSFTEISKAAGLFRGGYQGWSATWWDYNNDRFPDLYVANDFYGPDHLYKNLGGGRFEEVTWLALPHTPWFSMGSDAADINNDGWLDLFASDMSGSDHYKNKMGMGEMDKDGWFLEYAFPRQYMRNAMYLNTGKGRFMEVAQMLGLANTDWTWAVKFVDFDNDGHIDLFVTNGMTRDLTNSDFVRQVRTMTPEEQNAFWQGKGLKKDINLAFRNKGDLEFESVGPKWGLDLESVSNGAAAGDLDGDGDQDLVLTGYQEQLVLYRNHSSTEHLIKVRLKGTKSNRWGIGATVRIETSAGKQMRYLSSAQGYISANEPVVHFGLGSATKVAELVVEWPSGIRQAFRDLPADKVYTITEADESVPPAEIAEALFTRENGLYAFKHQENDYDDFKTQPLLPNRLSRLGPGMAWGDVDLDGDDDVYIGGAKGQAGALMINQGGGKFQAVSQPVFKADAESEDMGALFFDANGDHWPDLYVVSGGAEVLEAPKNLKDRLYLNAGKYKFILSPGATPRVYDSGGSVTAGDFDRDGDLDLFVGGRFVPGKYPLTPSSRLLANEKGVFTDVTDKTAPGLQGTGMVTSAVWSDVDDDGWLDLVVAHEWGPIRVWRNQDGKLIKHFDSAEVGLWNSIAPGDVDNDGDMDYIAGNLGLNTKYVASAEKPMMIYYGDVDGSGKSCVVEAQYEHGELFPVRGKSCSTHRMPSLENKFPTFHDFATATLREIYEPKHLEKAKRFEATVLESGVFINDGKGTLSFRPLPRLAQVAPVFGAVCTQVDGDGILDLYLVQNSYSPQRETGRMDGGVSLLLRGRGNGTFEPVAPERSGLIVPGDGKGLAAVDVNADNWVDFVATMNNNRSMVLLNRGTAEAKPIRIRLKGKPGNLTAVGARVKVVFDSGRSQIAELHAGGSYLSQPGRDLFFVRKGSEKIERVEARWPAGQSSTFTPSPEAAFLELAVP